MSNKQIASELLNTDGVRRLLRVEMNDLCIEEQVAAGRFPAPARRSELDNRPLWRLADVVEYRKRPPFIRARDRTSFASLAHALRERSVRDV